LTLAARPRSWRAALSINVEATTLPANAVTGRSAIKRYLPWIVATGLCMEQLDATIFNTAVQSIAASLQGARAEPPRGGLEPCTQSGPWHSTNSWTERPEAVCRENAKYIGACHC